MTTTELLPRPAQVARADTPWEPTHRRGFFQYASTSLSGLSIHFWILMAYLFLALSLVDEHFATLEKIRPRSLLGAAALVIAIGRGWSESIQRGTPLTPRHPQTYWLIAFLGACTFSMFWAYEYGEAKNAHIEHATGMVSFFLIVTIVRTRRELLLTLLVICAGLGTFLALSMREWMGGRYDYAQGVVRMMGIGRSNADPNTFAATVVFGLPLILWAGIYSRSWLIRLCSLAYVFMAIYAVFRSSSRSALVLTSITALWSLTILPKGLPRMLTVAALVGAAGFMLGGLSESQKKRIESLWNPDTYERESSTVGRIEGYRVGFQIYRENPVVGVGPGNWSTYRERKVDGNRLMPHNLTGQLIATRGTLGTLTFLGFLGVTFLYGWRQMRRRRNANTGWDHAVRGLCYTCLFGYALLLVSGLGAHNLERPHWAWLSALMIAAVEARNDEHERLSEEAA